MKKALLSLSACTLLFAACSKKQTVITREALVAGKWKLTTSKITIPQLGRLGQFDLLDTMETCRRDDVLDITAEHRLFYDQGAEKCNDLDSQRFYYGNWRLVNNENELEVTKNPVFGDLTFKINELSNATLHISKDTVIKTGGINFAGTADLIYRR